MKNNFTFSKGNDKIYRKTSNYFYPLFINSHDFIVSLFSNMSNINKNNPCEIDYLKPLYIPFEHMGYLVRNTLKNNFHPTLLEKYNLFCYCDLIKFYDAYDEQLRQKYDQNIGAVCQQNENMLESYIYIPCTGEICDVLSVIHEIHHFATGSYSEEVVGLQLLTEVLPILSEFITCNYFIEHYGHHPSYFEIIFERYDKINQINSQLEQVDYDFDKYQYDIEIYEEFLYCMATLITSKLFYDYKHDPETTMCNYNFLVNHLGVSDFNFIMKNVNVPIRLENGELHFQKKGLEKLMSYYEWTTKFMVDQYQISLKQSNQKNKTKN